jgi:hypothetical protein
MPPKKKAPADEARLKARKQEAKEKAQAKKEAAAPSALDKLRLKISRDAAADKKRREKGPPVNTRQRYAPSGQDVARQNEDDGKIRAFVDENIDLSAEDFKKAIVAFGQQANAPYGRRGNFDRIIQGLPNDEYIHQFFEKYTGQDKRGLVSYYELYIKKPAVVAAIKTAFKDGDNMYIERQKMEEMQRLIQSMAEEGDVVEEGEGEGGPGESKSLPGPVFVRTPPAPIVYPPVWNPGSPSTRPGYYRECIKLYSRPPWVEGVVKNVYLTQVEGGTNVGDYSSLETKKVVEGVTWHPVNKEYFKLQCNALARTRTQEENVLLVLTSDKKQVQLRIAYDTNRGFQIQDEEMFQYELEYLKERRMNYGDKLLKILQGPITEEAQTTAMRALSSYLLSAAPGVPDYKDTSEYINELVKELEKKSKTVQDLANEVGGITAYLISYTSKNNVSNFIKRIRGFEFTPATLANMSPRQKLPEIFANDNVGWELVEDVSNTIATEISLFVQVFATSVYKDIHITEQVPTQPTINPPRKLYSIPTPTDRIIASQGTMIDYTSEGRTYNLDVEDLLRRFRQGNFANPKNRKKQLDQDFIEDVGNKYGKPESESLDTISSDSVPPLSPAKLLTPGLIQMLEDGISQMKGEEKSAQMSVVGPNENYDDDSVSDASSQATDASSVSTDADASSVDSTDSYKQPPRFCASCGRPVLEDSNESSRTLYPPDGVWTVLSFCCDDCYRKYHLKRYKP